MRVHELARALGLPSRELLDRLRSDGEWVTSHMSAVAEPVANRYLPKQERPNTRARPTPTSPTPRGIAPSPILRDRALRPPRPRFKRRPGPGPYTMRQWSGDEYDDPIEDLRYAREITSRDVADLLGVTQATVRQWVARGYITPTGRIGPSNVFRTSDVLEAYDQIARRRKATGKPAEKRGWFEEPSPMDRIRTKHHDAVISINEAARLISVSPATIRSWLHRRHLEPLPSSKPREIWLRLGDVLQAAHARRLPARRRRLGR